MANKTAVELLAVLDSEAPQFSSAAIVVGFENGYGFTLVNDPHRTERLDDAMRRGGKACGLVGVVRRQDAGQGGYRIFPDFAKDKEVEAYLVEASRVFGQKYLEEPGRTTSYFVSTEPVPNR